MEDTRPAFERAADGVEGGERALQAMTNADAQLISTRPETLLMQLQGYAAVAAAEAEGDDLIGEVVRVGWMRIRATVHLSLGADADETASFFACGMLGNTPTAIGLPASTGR
ncbi:TetR family transcriptional regulator [Streptomyces graminofaciens]|uniref:TetR family transcriptional regulator n=1 Tax=Streptomyces graminofaciens TaxID=68212 RepID=A0ABM7FM89_9ACTN|nr:TetR family transcriptional regulator [Streptomyces graminofaciens]